MNEQIFWKGTSELIVSILIGVTLLYMTYKIMDRFIRNKYKIGIDNTSYAIFSGSVLFSVAYMITGIKDPILNSLQLVQSQAAYEGSPIFDAIKYSALFIGLIVLLTALINLIAISLFMLMTVKVDELAEMKRKNVSVSIITAVIIISISLMVKDSVYLILEAFVPYPEMPIIF